jgi:glutathione reductase (NADPH)
MESYDLVVLGAGSGGVATARRAAQYGAKVAVIEAGRLGGTCVNVGCVPKKLMWHAAEIAEALQHASGYGFNIGAVTHDWARLRARREAYIARLNEIYRGNLAKDGITVVAGHGELVDAQTVTIDGGTRTLRAERILIATGGQPQWPEVPGAELGIDSDGFFALDHCPKTVAIVGAGYIAVELCGVLQALGAQVTLFVRGDRVLREFDAMLGETLLTMLREQGVDVRTETQVRSLVAAEVGIRATLSNGASADYETLIWAIGRRPNTARCGLEAAGIALDAAGYVRVDEWQATNIPNIFAVGDVTGRAPLTPIAIAAGRRLADRLYDGQADRKLDYTNIPTVIFSHPPIGTIGLSEQAARQQFGTTVKVYESRFRALSYGVLDTKRDSRMKLVCVGPEARVAGIHVIGEGADELLQGFAVAVRMGATKRDFDDTIAIHPTSAEELVTLR